MLRVLDIFSGIGGFSLGLERTGGFRTVAFCEVDPFCRKVLAKHWPDVPCYEDVRELTAARLAADGIAVDVICGGFPCQDVSYAGKRAGMVDTRSGLWSEYARLVRELRPRLVVVENTAGLLSLGMDDVLGDLATLGFDAEWHCISAATVGAPHIRDRVWVCAYPSGLLGPEIIGREPDGDLSSNASPRIHPDADGSQWPVWQGIGGHLATQLATIERGGGSIRSWDRGPFDDGEVDDGLSTPVDALDAYGNAVVPQIPEMIGRAFLSALPQVA
jgi:DNA (cytosine-5)-methyltransferase 1